jgi:hypothetical protein
MRDGRGQAMIRPSPLCRARRFVVVKPRISLAPTSLGPVEKLRGPLEDQLSSALQVAVERVDDHYHGESVEEVTGELLDETKVGLHRDIAEGFEPDRGQLRSVARTIVQENS